LVTQPPDPDIEHLLAELRSDDPARRKAAAEAVEQRGLRVDELDQALKRNALNDPNQYARQAAEQALVSLGVIAPPVSAARAAAAWFQSHQAKIVQFTMGFVGWFVINGILWFLASGNITLGLVLFPANLVVLILVARRRQSAALGMLSAIAVNLVIALIIGIAIAGWCFIPFFTPLPHN